ERERPRRRSLAEHDVEPEVLEGRVEDLLGSPVEPVDLVHEQHVALVQRGQDRRHVLLLQRGPGHRAHADAELLAHDLRQRRLAEPGRADEQHVVERLAAPARRVERDGELLLRSLLADEVVEAARPQRALEGLVVAVLPQGRQQGAARHAALRRTSRTCSSTGSSGSSCASACSASSADQPSSTSAARASAAPPATGGAPASATAAGGPTRSFSSSTIRSAVLRPMPGIAWKRAWSPSTIARRSSAAGEPETTASATFGPTPLTPSSSVNRSRSSASAKPYSWSASSRTCRYVSTVTSSPRPTARTAAGVAATR